MRKLTHITPSQQPLDDLQDQLVRGDVLLLNATRRSPKVVRPGSKLAACADALAAIGRVRISRHRNLTIVRRAA